MTAVWRRPVTGEPLEATEDEPEPSPIAPDYTIDNVGELKMLPLFVDAATAK
jgi:hypothetical protein